MKILIIGGSAESLMNFRGELISALVHSGHDVMTAAGYTSSETIEQLLENKAKFTGLPINRTGLNPLQELKTLVSIYKLISEMKPDKVLAYTIKPIIWSGLAHSLVKGRDSRSFIAMITGLGYAFEGNSIKRNFIQAIATKLYKLSLINSDKVVFQNYDDRDSFVSRKIVKQEKSFRVYGSGVSLKRFTKFPLKTEPMVFLMIGRLLIEKGFREFVAAAKIVKADYPSVVFRIVAPIDNSPDRIPDGEITQWRKDGAIEIVDGTKDVKPYIENCSVYVLPSYHEGMPRTVLEAMAVGRPILTTNVRGCKDTVNTNLNGHLVEAKNHLQLAQSMEWFINNKSMLETMGNESRRLVEEKFDVISVNRMLFDIMGLDYNVNFNSAKPAARQSEN